MSHLHPPTTYPWLYNGRRFDDINRFAIGIVGDAGVRGTAQQPRLFVGMILILIFAEVLGKPSCCF